MEVVQNNEIDPNSEIQLREQKIQLFLDESNNRGTDSSLLLLLTKSYIKKRDFLRAEYYLSEYIGRGNQYSEDVCSMEITLAELRFSENGSYPNFARIRLLTLLRYKEFNEELRKKILLTNTKAAITSEDWVLCETLFALLQNEKYISAEKQNTAKEILFKAKSYAPLPPTMYLAFSAVIPGLGQAISGEPLDGLISFSLNTGLAALSVFSLLRADIADFAFIEFPLFLRFYQGNLANAKKAGSRVEDTKRNTFKKQLLNLLPS